MTARSSLETITPTRPGPTLLGVLVLLLASALPAAAQYRDWGPILLDIPASTRALGLGNSFSLTSGSSEAIFYQPGLLSRAQGYSASIQRFGTSATQVAASAGGSWLSGGVSLGVQHLSYGVDVYELLEDDNRLNLPADKGSLRTNGNIGVSEMVLSLGLGRTVKGIQVGAVGKLIEQRFGRSKAATAAIDIGLSSSTGPLVVGLAVQNLGEDLTISGAEVPLPVRYSLGASTQTAQVGPLDLSASGAVIYQQEEKDLVPSAGIEVAYWPVNGRTFIGRFGFRHLPDGQSGSPITFGGGFRGDNIVLDYAYEGFDSGSPTHRIGIGWR
ncbi:MAG: hypothetical protein HKO65_09670 [Gemmatimonadetes bacterium]|nr:hypothetical protein [Gemmatimonadota bacterium]NNM05360.1 hypothetical protein [Gemmatimonadota bacterium]